MRPPVDRPGRGRARGARSRRSRATREHLIGQYGTISGPSGSADRPTSTIDEILIEKPNPTLAELRLQVPGLRAGHYLCFFGMHVLTPTVFDLLGQPARPRTTVREFGSIQLTTALNDLARRERYLALGGPKGARHNLGLKFGVVEAQIALALAGVDRDRMLTTLLESVVRVEQGRVDRAMAEPANDRTITRRRSRRPGTRCSWRRSRATDPAIRNRSIGDLVARGLRRRGLLDGLPRGSKPSDRRAESLYERVRASMFLHAIYRYRLQDRPTSRAAGRSRSRGSTT